MQELQLFQGAATL